MDEQGGKFFELVVRGLNGNEEKKILASEELQQEMAAQESGAGETTDFTALIDRLKSSNAAASRSWLWFFIIVFSLGFGLISYNGWLVNKSRAVILGALGNTPAVTGSLESESSGLKDAERLLLYGEPRHVELDDQWRALWQSEPENPAYYIEYMLATESEHDSFAPDMVEYGEQIDPGNAWFRVMQASILAKESVEKKSVPRSSAPGRRSGRRGRNVAGNASTTGVTVVKPLTQWEVTDQVKYDESLSMLYDAAEMQKMASYRSDLLEERLELLPKGEDWATQVGPIAYVAAQMSSSIQITYLSKLLRAEAQRCGREKDGEGLMRLLQAWKKMGHLIHSDGASLIDALVLRAWIQAPLRDFSEAAKLCDLSSLGKEFGDLHLRLEEEKEQRHERAKLSETLGEDKDFDQKASIWLHMAAPIIKKQVNDSSSIDPLNLKPGRMADHALVARAINSTGWLLFLIVAGATWGVARSKSLYKEMVVELRVLLSIKDWLWVALFGGVIPLAWFVLIYGFSQWSARETSALFVVLLQPFGQFACLWLMIFLAPALVISIRLKRLASFLGSAVQRYLWISVILAAMAMPVFGLINDTPDQAITILYAAYGMLILAIVLPVCAFLFRRRKMRAFMPKLLIADNLTPCCAVASMLLACMTLVHYAQERYWVSHDEEMKPQPGFISPTRIEAQVTKQIFLELEVLIQELDDIRS